VLWDIIDYAAADGSVPAIEFLDGCPTKVAANLLSRTPIKTSLPAVASSGPQSP